MRPKGIVILLERVPVIENVAISTHTACEHGKPWHANLRCKLAGYRSQRGILGKGPNRRDAGIVQHLLAAIAYSSGIYERGAEDVGLFQGRDLAIGLGI